VPTNLKTTNLKLALAVLAGISIGVIGSRTMHAQQPGPLPGYVVAEVDAHDPEAMAKYGAKVPETLTPFHHHYVILSSKIEALEGEPPKGAVVMIAFDSVEKAKEWYNSPAYAAVRPIRQGAATSRIYIVEGAPAP
jgi:uncharacterized protein (DUF1330 family)